MENRGKNKFAEIKIFFRTTDIRENVFSYHRSSLLSIIQVEEPRPDFSRFVTEHVDHVLTSAILECTDLLADVSILNHSDTIFQ